MSLKKLLLSGAVAGMIFGTLSLTACGGSGGGGDNDHSNPGTEWDDMQWDEGEWQ